MKFLRNNFKVNIEELNNVVPFLSACYVTALDFQV